MVAMEEQSAYQIVNNSQFHASRLMAKQTGSSYSMPHGTYAQMPPVRHARSWHTIGVPTLPRRDGGIASLDDPLDRRSAREETPRGDVRMRNSGIGLFIMGVLLLSQGVDGAANRLTPVGRWVFSLSWWAPSVFFGAEN